METTQRRVIASGTRTRRARISRLRLPQVTAFYVTLDARAIGVTLDIKIVLN